MAKSKNLVLQFSNSLMLLCLLILLLSYCVNEIGCQMQMAPTINEDKKSAGSLPSSSNNNPGGGSGLAASGGGGGGVPPPSPTSTFYNYLRCWRCDYDDKDQCVKNFDFTKHKHEACDGKCLKAFEKVEARTKTEIDKAQMTPTIRKCVSQREITSLQALGINTKNGCHDIRTTKRKHKLYCFCENDLCNRAAIPMFPRLVVFNILGLLLIVWLFIVW